MKFSNIITVIIVTIILLSVVAYSIIKAPFSTTDKSEGTSLVVLVDFSKSFAATRKGSGSLDYGLRKEDLDALKNVSSGIAKLSTSVWMPPLKVIWTKIQTSSIISKPICAPLETLEQIIIKHAGSISSEEDIDSVLTKCAKTVYEVSQDKQNLSAYTDISGSVAMASEIAPAEYDKKVIVILSDFHEDIPPGSQKAEFKLNGEHVVMLHRPGTDEPDDVMGYLERVEKWKKIFLAKGASAVETISVNQVTKTRIIASLSHDKDLRGTALTIMVDFKENVSRALENNSNEIGLLIRIGQTLSELARDWQEPVTALWIAMGSSGFNAQTLPPIEYNSILIKKKGEINTVNELKDTMRVFAMVLERLGKISNNTNISGNLALACAVEPVPKSHILIIISDFVDVDQSNDTLFNLNPNTRVIMLHIASPEDRINPNLYPERRRKWVQRFKEAGATEVCQIPLMSFTQNDLRSCLGNFN